jgi:hypothetical protein
MYSENQSHWSIHLDNSMHLHALEETNRTESEGPSSLALHGLRENESARRGRMPELPGSVETLILHDLDAAEVIGLRYAVRRLTGLQTLELHDCEAAEEILTVCRSSSLRQLATGLHTKGLENSLSLYLSIILGSCCSL